MTKQIEPYSEEWQQKANQLARSFAPSIYPCAKCHMPVASGYCCTYCGTTDPREPNEGYLK